MSSTNIILIVYSAFMIFGGYMGYAKAGSKASLIAGTISGLLVLLGIYLAGSKPQVGYGLIVAVTGLLSIQFGIRLVKTGSFMPTGMLAIVSIIALILSITQLTK